MKDFMKTLRIGTSKNTGNIFIHVEFKDGKLSISGVEGPRANGNCQGGCGQIDMSYAHRNPADNDPRNKHIFGGTEYDSTIYPESITFAPGWDSEKWFDLLDIWKRWHLNDMQSACEHQRALGWKYDTHRKHRTEVHTPAIGLPGVVVTYTKAGQCPTCGYLIGSAWLKEEVPAAVIKQLQAFPDTDVTPAWV